METKTHASRGAALALSVNTDCLGNIYVCVSSIQLLKYMLFHSESSHRLSINANISKGLPACFGCWVSRECPWQLISDACSTLGLARLPALYFVCLQTVVMLNANQGHTVRMAVLLQRDKNITAGCACVSPAAIQSTCQETGEEREAKGKQAIRECRRPWPVLFTIYLFGCTTYYLWRVESSVFAAACGFFSCNMQDIHTYIHMYVCVYIYLVAVCELLVGTCEI